MSTLAPTLQAFFTDRLIRQRHASGHTIAAYRDTFRLLLAFAEQQTGSTPSRLRIADLDAPLVSAFLDHLETVRGNGVRTRNARLAAVHSLFRYAALRHPEDSAVIQRVLAIPPKRFDRTIITYLSEAETDALLAAPDQSTRTGRRDHAMLATAVQTGLRASELVSLSVNDVHLGTGAHVSCLGKGRKQRITPLTASTVTVLKNWLEERAGLAGRPAVPRPHRHPDEPRRPRKTPGQACGDRCKGVPDARGEENLASRHAPHSGHALAGSRRRHHRDRPLARPRVGRHHSGLHPRRPRAQRTGDRQDRPQRRATGTIPAVRRRHRVPRQPVIMPSK